MTAVKQYILVATMTAMLLVIATGCDSSATDDHAETIAPVSDGGGDIPGTTTAPSGDQTAWDQRQVEAYRIELVEVAFEAATKIPVQPHIKTRSREQNKTVALCLELGLPQQALRYIEQVDNWQRGVGYADLAFYLVRHGYADDVQPYLDKAALIAETPSTDWRRDRIRAKIARTYAWLGQMDRAAAFEAGVEDSESGQVARVNAMRCTDEQLDAQMDAFDQIIAAGTFDSTRNVLAAYALLFDRFYDNAERRNVVEEKLKKSWAGMPLAIRISFVLTLADTALDHDDQTKALAFVNDAQTIIDSIDAAVQTEDTEDEGDGDDAGQVAGMRWPLRHRIPMVARVAAMRARAGDGERARHDVDALLSLYEKHRERIANIDRAEALRSVAEAYRALGDAAAALAVYKRAVEAGVANPNSRPRAEDLGGTCRSMALHAAKPDAELWSRIREINGALGTPW